MGAPAAQYARTRDGYNIACYVAGEGPTLIRTPTLWNHVSRMWKPGILGEMLDSLAARFRLVLYDGRGQGLSARNLPPSMPFEDLLLDLEAVLERLGTDRVILMGWSFLAAVSIEFAARYPDRVEALILWDYKDSGASENSTPLLDLAKRDWHLFVQTTARIGFPQVDHRLIEPILFDAMTQADHVTQARALYSTNGSEMLSRVTVPTLVLVNQAGTRPFAAEEAGREWSALLPNARLVIFDDGDGFGRTREGVPEAVLAMAEFIQGVEGGMGLSKRGPNLEQNTVALSSRELEVLKLISQGKSNQQIASELVISLNTVQNHVRRILEKTELSNRTQAALYAREHGIV